MCALCYCRKHKFHMRIEFQYFLEYWRWFFAVIWSHCVYFYFECTLKYWTLHSYINTGATASPFFPNNMVENSPETEFVSLHFRFSVGAICLFANYSFYTYKILKRNRKRRWRERLADTEKSRWIGNTGILLYKHTDTYTKSIRSVALNMCSCILILIYCVSKKLRHL